MNLLMRVRSILFFVLVIMCFSFSSVYGVDYYSSSDIFQIIVVETYNNDNGYFVKIEIENFADEELDFDIELLYSNENLVSGKKSISCKDKCFVDIEIKKVFFEEYRIITYSKYNKKNYINTKRFNLEVSKGDVELDLINVVFVDSVSGPNISGMIYNRKEILMNESESYTLEIFPKSRKDFRQYFDISCVGDCSFSFRLMQPYVLDDYQVNLYSSIGEDYDFFRLALSNETQYERARLPKKFFYNNYGIEYSSVFDFEVDGEKKSIRDISLEDRVDLDLKILDGNVKNIKVKNTKVSETSIGFEYVPKNKVSIKDKIINNLFAINPVFSPEVDVYNVSFVAMGYEVFKCSDYNFAEQNCFGEFVKILDTIPGENYTISLTPTDPIFAETISISANDGRARNGVFDVTTAPLQIGNDNNIIADSYFRFENLSIPPSSTINSVYLSFTSASAQTRNTVYTNIYALKETSCNHFDTAAGGDDPTNNQLSSNFVAWDSIATWASGQSNANTVTPNLNSIVQEVVDIAGWQKGNPICFAIKDDGSSRRALREIQSITGNAASISINYTAPPVSILWNYTTLDIDAPRGQDNFKDAKVFAVFDNNNVVISELGGNGSSFISVNVTSVGNLNDGDDVIVSFNCSPDASQAIGNYVSVFNVNSSEDSSGTNISVECFVFDEAKLEIINPNTFFPRDVVDGEEIVVNASYTDIYGNQVSDYFDVVEVRVGDIPVEITDISPLQFTSNYNIAAYASRPRGITVWGDEMWVVNEQNNMVIHFYTDGTYIDSFDISAYTKLPKGIFTPDGDIFYVVDDTNDRVMVMGSSFNLISSFSVAAQTGVPYGISFNGSVFFVVDNTNDRILSYSSLGSFIGSFSVAGYSNTPVGVTHFEDKLWVLDSAGRIENFYMNGTYIGSFSITAQTNTATGIDTIDGFQFYISDDSNDRIIYYEKKNVDVKSDHFEFNITLPTGLAGLQDLYVRIYSYGNDKISYYDLETGSLNFPEKDPPASVTNLQNISRSHNWILWSWTNPLDADFDHVELWLDGIFLTNVSGNFYNVTGLSENTNYTLSTRTVDSNGNVNLSWVNNTAETLTIPSVSNLMPVSFTQFFRNDSVLISANVSDKYGISSVKAFVVWSSGSNFYDMADSDSDGVYEYNFTNTQTYGYYNVTIVASNNLGIVNDTETILFEVISDTPFLDTYVSAKFPTRSYGTSSTILVNGNPGDTFRGLVQFDISYLPLGIRIDSAMMNLYLTNSKGANLNVSAYHATSVWDESSTWDTQPSFDSIIWDSNIVSTANQWYSWNITELSESWYNQSRDNYGVVLKEPAETTVGEKAFASSESGSNVPELIISYTDIQFPAVSDVSPALNTNFTLGQRVEISAKVTDNIGVSKVFANVSWNGGYEVIELVDSGFFIYKKYFTNTFTLGNYNITIIANDTYNLVNDSVKTSFNIGTVGLTLTNNISRVDDDKFNVKLRLYNNENLQTPVNKTLYVYGFVPDSYNVSEGFLHSSSARYNVQVTNTSIISNGLNGTIFKIAIRPSNPLIGVLASYISIYNYDNSCLISFNVTGNGAYDFSDLFMAGFDPS